MTPFFILVLIMSDSERIYIRLDAELKEAIKDVAKEDRLTPSQWVRNLAKKELDKRKKK